MSGKMIVMLIVRLLQLFSATLLYNFVPQLFFNGLCLKMFWKTFTFFNATCLYICSYNFFLSFFVHFFMQLVCNFFQTLPEIITIF